MSTSPNPDSGATLVPVSSQGVLRDFAQAGVLSLAAVHVAQTSCRLIGEANPSVLLAVALAVRALEAGSVSLELSSVRHEVEAVLLDRSETEQQTGLGPVTVPTLPWPEPETWLQALTSSPAVASELDPPNRKPLRLVDNLLYLERYWGNELSVRSILDERVRDASVGLHSSDEVARAQAIAEASYTGTDLPDEQQIQAAVSAAFEPTVVLAGGPGTGKTATVARMLATRQAWSQRQLSVALAAPSGKAAARLHEAVHSALAQFPTDWPHLLPVVDPAFTVHRLLESRGQLRGFGRDSNNRLPHDIVVIDETSMLSLPLMAQLLTAVRPEATLILVGDPMQLTSVEAGSVLADLTVSARAGSRRVKLVELQRNWRSGGAIAQLADAIRAGDSASAVAWLRSGDAAITFVETEDPLALVDVPSLHNNLATLLGDIHQAATAGASDVALSLWDRHRLLCAHRTGPFGVAWWARQVDQLQRELDLPTPRAEWYPGRGVLVTRNADELGLRNGDTGVAVESDAGLRVAFPRPGDTARLLPPWVLDEVETLHAMTVHKAQGSQFDDVTFVLPPVSSPLLTRELVYTALTRAKESITVIGSAAAFEKAIATPAARTSGLARGW